MENPSSRCEEDPDPVAKSQSKSSDGSESDRDSAGYPCNYKLQLLLTPSASTATGKRPHEEDGDGSDSSCKRSHHENKKSRTEETKPPCTPGGLFNKLWSDEDEIAMLNGMIDFTNLKGPDPSADDMRAFYDSIQGNLQGGFTREQLKNKKKKLRERFVNALNKCRSSGCDPLFSKPHEEMIFRLSKKIWANSCDGSKNKTPERSKVKENNDGEKTEFWSKYPSFYESFHKMENSPSFSISDSGFSLMKERLSLIGSAKAKQVDDEWRQLIVEEMEIKCKQMELQCKQVEINNKMFALMTQQFKMAFDH